MKFLALVLLLSSEIALGAVCGKSKAEVEVSGLGINFDAEAPVSCEYTKSAGSVTGVFTVKLDEMKSGIPLRDEHLQLALNAGKNPTMKFTLNAWPLKSGPVVGDLTLNGKTLKVSDWKAEVDGSTVSIHGTVDYTTFGLETAKYRKAGVVLATCPNVVGVTVEIKI